MTIESFDPEKLPGVGDTDPFEEREEPAAREAAPRVHWDARIPPKPHLAPPVPAAGETAGEPAGGGDLGVAPVDRLTHSIIANRPLDEVLRLITLLDESPEHARVATEAVKAAALERSVDDVTELVERLSRPPHSIEAADEAIRTATEHRPVDDVSRLVTLLHRTPEDARAADEAISYAARTRSVEELAQLISRLGQDAGTVTRAVGPPTPYAPLSGIDPHEPPAEDPRPARAGRGAGAPLWLRAPMAGALLVCGVLAFPALGPGTVVALYGLFLLAGLLCLAVAARLLFTARSAGPVLLGGVVLAGALGAVRLVPAGAAGDTLASALRHTLAPDAAVTVVALLAVALGLGALAALTLTRHRGAPFATGAERSDEAKAAGRAGGRAEAWEAYLRGEQLPPQPQEPPAEHAQARPEPATERSFDAWCEGAAGRWAERPADRLTEPRPVDPRAAWPITPWDEAPSAGPAAERWAAQGGGAWGETTFDAPPEWGPRARARRSARGESPEGH